MYTLPTLSGFFFEKCLNHDEADVRMKLSVFFSLHKQETDDDFDVKVVQVVTDGALFCAGLSYFNDVCYAGVETSILSMERKVCRNGISLLFDGEEDFVNWGMLIFSSLKRYFSLMDI